MLTLIEKIKTFKFVDSKQIKSLLEDLRNFKNSIVKKDEKQPITYIYHGLSDRYDTNNEKYLIFNEIELQMCVKLLEDKVKNYKN